MGQGPGPRTPWSPLWRPIGAAECAIASGYLNGRDGRRKGGRPLGKHHLAGFGRHLAGLLGALPDADQHAAVHREADRLDNGGAGQPGDRVPLEY